MSASCSFVSCNSSYTPLNSNLKPRIQRQSFSLRKRSLQFSHLFTPGIVTLTSAAQNKGFLLLRCRNSIKSNNSEEDSGAGDESVPGVEKQVGGGGGEARDWTTSILLFVLWGVLIFYVFNLTPDQTPSRDLYFLKKLLNLKGDDGFQMNEVLVSLWYIMGLWPLVYTMLLLPTGRSSKGGFPAWPFLLLSCFGGAYALLPYFIIWRPPPPAIEEAELRTWPLNFLESKLTAGISLAAGVGLILYAGLQDVEVWKEFYQYFRESKFIHVMSLDCCLLSAFAPFWVYNDMTVRRWYNRGFWLLPLSLIPLVGPCLYLVLRPSILELPFSASQSEPEQNVEDAIN